MTEPRFNRHDICEAWHLYLFRYYELGNKEQRKRRDQLMSHFTMPRYIRDEDDLDENARAIFDQLVDGLPEPEADL